MGMEPTFGTMVLPTVDNGMKTRLTVEESMNGLMEGGTKEIGRIITCMEEVSTHGRTAEDMKESITMIESMALALISGKMGASTLGSGRMGSSMERECIDSQTEQKEEGTGKKGSASSGQMNDCTFLLT